MHWLLKHPCGHLLGLEYRLTKAMHQQHLCLPELLYRSDSALVDSTLPWQCDLAGDTSNLDMSTAVWMQNVVEALEATGAPLKHVYFTQG